MHTLSPAATAFGGNFNKAALVFLTLLLPFLRVHALPGPPYIYVIWIAVICNIAAFSGYSYLQIQSKMQKEEQKVLEEPLDSSESGSGSDDEDSSSDGKLC